MTLTRFVAERLLYRLGASRARDRCILKGASLLAVWLPDPYRATRDIDVLASGPTDEDAIRSLVAEICAVPCSVDGVRFDVSELVVDAIRSEDEYSGQRARFRAFLGNARIAVQVDIGVGDAVAGPIEEIDYPTMLPALPTPRLRAYPRQVAVAEKFEAMVKLDTRNSRMKDFHDVWALAGGFAFEGPALRSAVAACFERRGTPWTAEAPRALTAAFYQMPEIESRWRRYLEAGAVLVPPPAQFESIGERIIRFLGPVRESILAGEPFPKIWTEGGPWHPTR
ncbi:MAG: nucleotidyl transferase AbiEii/AbiGii toxin family protein [Deltaproteobacteria bacterium]|nr:nucleotidyl transferase AbiEii/AbiGii toxin family protein [Deltaproteobacteria bacterium]